MCKVKGVNLGGWLVVEGWMKPSLKDGIINNDLLDGRKIHLKSVTTKKFVSAKNGGGFTLVANGSTPSDWETFKLWRINEDTFNFRICGNNQFMGVTDGNSDVVAVATTTPGASETFQIIRSADKTQVRIKAPNGFFLQAKTQDLVTADYEGDGDWGDDNPSVFLIDFPDVKVMEGEYQITNGYGPERAPQVMREHWDTFIVEDDFRFISENGINAVRIPVGWWIASDPTPPQPFVGGSLEALDKAFTWAQKYGIKVIITLHAVPGSQNGYEHSASRDGSVDWDKNDQNIQQSVSAIDFLANRYSNHPSLYAVELLNEPHGVSFETLEKYYKQGYDAVRRHSSTVYVIMSNRLDDGMKPKELFRLASGLQSTVIDVHYYNLFTDDFKRMNVQENIDHVNNKIASYLKDLTTSDGPLIFVGEWVAAMEFKGATKEDYQRFAKAQLQVYGQASFGWAYWSLKHAEWKHWSLELMIKEGYINLKE